MTIHLTVAPTMGPICRGGCALTVGHSGQYRRWTSLGARGVTCGVCSRHKVSAGSLAYPNVYPKNCDVYLDERWCGPQLIFRFSPSRQHSCAPASFSGPRTFLHVGVPFYKVERVGVEANSAR